MHPKIIRHFKKADPKLFRVLEKIENLEEITSVAPSRYFSQLCREIIGQQLSGKVVKVFWERFKSKGDWQLDSRNVPYVFVGERRCILARRSGFEKSNREDLRYRKSYEERRRKTFKEMGAVSHLGLPHSLEHGTKLIVPRCASGI